jgi:SNF2 family DNA or RNA helicase
MTTASTRVMTTMPSASVEGAGQPAPSSPARALALKCAPAYGRIYVSGPAMHGLRRMPGAAFNPHRNVYELSLTLETLRGMATELGVSRQALAETMTPELRRWASAAAAIERSVNEMHTQLAAGYRAELPWSDTTGDEQRVYRPPFDHQRVMATAALALDGVGFMCDMGTGKTRAAIEVARAKMEAGTIGTLLIACPKGVMVTWQRQFREWWPGVRPLLLVDMPVAERRKALERAQPGQVFVVNYDVLAPLQRTIVARGGRLKLGFICDESHLLRNPSAKMTAAAMEVARVSAWRLPMTGTPILNGAENIWSQWYLVDLGVTFGANFVQFRREFFTENTYTWSLDPKPGTLDEVGLRMRRRGIRFRKDECLDLPPKVYEVEQVELSEVQRKAYHQMQEDLVAELSDGSAATAANALVSILRLSQITSGFVPDSETGVLHRFTPNPKLVAAERLVRELLVDNQVIVWAHYREDVRALREVFADFHPVTLIGGMTIDQRKDAEERFQRGETRLLIGNPAAGGVGVDLYAASAAVYYSMDYALDDRLQSEDRCHRRGSERHHKVTYVDLIARGTVDELVQDAVARKKSVAEIVVDLKRHIGLGMS